MTLTQLIDRLRDMQAKYGDVPVYLGQASGCDLPARTILIDRGATPTRLTIYPESED